MVLRLRSLILFQNTSSRLLIYVTDLSFQVNGFNSHLHLPSISQISSPSFQGQPTKIRDAHQLSGAFKLYGFYIFVLFFIHANKKRILDPPCHLSFRLGAYSFSLIINLIWIKFGSLGLEVANLILSEISFPYTGWFYDIKLQDWCVFTFLICLPTYF